MNDSAKLAAMAREIGQLAPVVGKEYTDQQDAFNQQHMAEVRLLTSLVNMVKPGLAAICGPVPNIVDGPPSTFHKGILLHAGVAEDKTPVRLYLLSNATFWKQWVVFHETLDVSCDGYGKMSAEAVAAQYDVAPMIATLHGLLVKQAGKRKPSTSEAWATTRKLRAILTLLDCENEQPVEQPASEPAQITDGSDIPF